MITTHDVEQGSDAWHALRDGLYTGSNADKLLKHGTATKSVNGIASKYALTESSEFSGNFHTKRGHLLEEEALELYSIIHKIEVSRPGFITNSKYPNCGYSPDGMTDKALLEVKCFSEAKHNEIVNGRIPLKIMAQIHFGLLITEKPTAFLIAYNPKLDPKVALAIIRIKPRPAVLSNFKRILSNKESK